MLTYANTQSSGCMTFHFHLFKVCCLMFSCSGSADRSSLEMLVLLACCQMLSKDIYGTDTWPEKSSKHSFITVYIQKNTITACEIINTAVHLDYFPINRVNSLSVSNNVMVFFLCYLPLLNYNNRPNFVFMLVHINFGSLNIFFGTLNMFLRWNQFESTHTCLRSAL